MRPPKERHRRTRENEPVLIKGRGQQRPVVPHVDQMPSRRVPPEDALYQHPAFPRREVQNRNIRVAAHVTDDVSPTFRLGTTRYVSSGGKVGGILILGSRLCNRESGLLQCRPA